MSENDQNCDGPTQADCKTHVVEWGDLRKAIGEMKTLASLPNAKADEAAEEQAMKKLVEAARAVIQWEIQKEESPEPLTDQESLQSLRSSQIAVHDIIQRKCSEQEVDEVLDFALEVAKELRRKGWSS